MKAYSLFTVLVAFTTLSLSGCKDHSISEDGVKIDTHPTIRVGMSRDQVVAMLGKPTSSQTWVKSELPVFGPLGGLWRDLANGEKVEIWDFPDSRGDVSIYFWGPSNAVWHTVFIRKGIVF